MEKFAAFNIITREKEQFGRLPSSFTIQMLSEKNNNRDICRVKRSYF